MMCTTESTSSASYKQTRSRDVQDGKTLSTLIVSGRTSKHSQRREDYLTMRESRYKTQGNSGLHLTHEHVSIDAHGVICISIPLPSANSHPEHRRGRPQTRLLNRRTSIGLSKTCHTDCAPDPRPRRDRREWHLHLHAAVLVGDLDLLHIHRVAKDCVRLRTPVRGSATRRRRRRRRCAACGRSSPTSRRS